jgi:hypothetical protein
VNEVVPWSQSDELADSVQQDELAEFQAWEDQRVMQGKGKSAESPTAPVRFTASEVHLRHYPEGTSPFWKDHSGNDAAAEVRCELLMMS